MPRDMQIVGKGKCMLVGCRLTDLHLFALRYLHPERGKPVSRSQPEHARTAGGGGRAHVAEVALFFTRILSVQPCLTQKPNIYK